ncbi:DEAD/DEAH box helicase [Pseudocolwellia agarivorans]|uniref:DEAD/DEAH box helicase n=1 Tax=Pseudocolwellia agarivorans TaxID=1911682 RepID=UPI000984CAFE|nr:DEAD/DEAH box helicase [Pseudocolwellia agarivorans]
MENMEPLIEKLEIVSIQHQLSNIHADNISILNEKDIRSLLGGASILSLSTEPEEKSLAYEIVSRLLEITDGKDHKVTNAAEVVLSRLGNFPSRKLLRNRHNSSEEDLPVFLKMECITREIENTIFINEHEDNVIQLTDFQYEFYESLKKEKNLSISAPTSAGKSFVLGLDLVRKFKSGKDNSIVYVVPTRALISEVSLRVRKSLKENELEEVIVRTAPFPVSKKHIRTGVIYVLTQERLMSYLNADEAESPFISALIVDEAHEVQKGKRGILLQNTVELVIRKFPNCDVLFASPLIKNPGYFLSLFDKVETGKFFTETISPVSQNILLLSEIAKKPSLINIQLLASKCTVNIGDLNLGFRFRDAKPLQKASLAKAIVKKNESVIIFANGPTDAENVANKLSEINNDFIVTHEVQLFIDFLIKDIHPDYALIKCLRGGVGFHYGKMPSIVRTGIEHLFKTQKISFICSTSTLLQGVNLPAKHIIIENPQSGVGVPMSRSDFQNLSGRAGRLLHEFHGNIWCLRPDTWTEPSYQGEKLQEVTAALDTVMKDGGLLIQDLLNDNLENDKRQGEAEIALGKLYHDIHFSDLSTVDKYQSEENKEALDQTIEQLTNLEITVDKNILERHKAIRPDHLQNLYDVLTELESLEDYMLIAPFYSEAKDKMGNAFQLIIYCFDLRISEQYKNWIIYLAQEWIWGKKLGSVLVNRVEFIQERDPNKSTSSIIRDTLGVLEEQVRFQLVKYFSAYIDVLKLVLLEKGKDPDDISIEPYHVYLEFGSFKPEALSLMALGLSRFTALYLVGKFATSDDPEIEEYLGLLKTMNIDAIDMPALCREEIRR